MTHYHQITPRGALTTALRHVQDLGRQAQLTRAPGVLVYRTTRGVHVQPMRRAGTAAGAATLIPRYG